MSRLASSSPLRKKARLSSPTYDAQFADFDTLDFQALDELETCFSQSTPAALPSQTAQSNPLDKKEKRRLAEETLEPAGYEEHDDSGIMLEDVEEGCSTMAPTSSIPIVTQASFHAVGLTSATPVLSAVDKSNGPAIGFSSAAFLPVSLMVSAADLNPNVHRSPSPEVPPEPDHDAWFAPLGDTTLPTAFASASTLTTLGIPGGISGAATPKLVDFPTKIRVGTWASPSTAALEKAKEKLKVWEAEIDSELSVADCSSLSTDTDNKPAGISREPLKGVENSISSATLFATAPRPSASIPGDSTSPVAGRAAPCPFKAPALKTPRADNSFSTPSHPTRSIVTNPVLARSSAATDIILPGWPLPPSSYPTPITPIRPNVSHASLLPQTRSSSTPSNIPRSHNSLQQQENTPKKARPLGLTVRAHAFTGSASRPKFVTPFKKGINPGEQRRQIQPNVSQPKTPSKIQQQVQPQPHYEGKGKGREIMLDLQKKKPDASNPKDMVDLPASVAKKPSRLGLADSGLVPQTHSHEQLSDMGLDISLLNLTTVSHFLYYRFNPSNIHSRAPSTQMSLGPDTALSTLLAMGCNLATKEWVDNHWSLILWKMIGMACLEPTALEKRWCWDEVIRQLRYRYKRELEKGSRPSLRLITTRDAPSTGPIVFCVSDIFWTDEYVDGEGRLVLAHPELEITDGWYRLRANVDEALARATRNKVLRIGRKVACCGAKLESSKKDPMEVLDAYGSVHLVLCGNSTHLAPWHAKLGFQSVPFVATLGSLSSDGGGIPLMDLVIMQVFPVGFIEFITTESGEVIREGPRTEKDEAMEEDRWKNRRFDEAAKLQEALERKLHRIEKYADRLENIAGDGFQPAEDESPPDSIEDLAEELEDSEDPAYIFKNLNKRDAGWLSLHLRDKCQSGREKADDDIERELAMSFPPRQVRNFRVLRVSDARTARKSSWRTAQLTVWDVMSLNITEGRSAGSFNVGQRYMVSSLVPNQQSAWMGVEPGAEVYLSTRRDSKWKVLG